MSICTLATNQHSAFVLCLSGSLATRNLRKRICLAPRAPLMEAWGNAQESWHKKAPALKARFTFGAFRSIVGVMPQSLSKVLVHIIFSTKDREPWLGLDVRPRMHAYLATVCRDLGAEVVRVGGVADHVHIVTTLPRTVSQAQLIEQIKKVSSKWIKTLDARYRSFFWQRGYGAFSVSPSQLRSRTGIR